MSILVKQLNHANAVGELDLATKKAIDFIQDSGNEEKESIGQKDPAGQSRFGD